MKRSRAVIFSGACIAGMTAGMFWQSVRPLHAEPRAAVREPFKSGGERAAETLEEIAVIL